jgi:8-oxo-dGTP diphosphatase
MTDFDGAKIAILRGDDVLTLQRDDRPDIPYPGEWDLPGGGRECNETPIQTAARELLEELNVRLDPSKIIYSAEELAEGDSQERVHFFMARWDDLFDDGIILGDEGQRWRWMPIPDFLSRKDVVKPLRGRLRRALKIRAF